MDTRDKLSAKPESHWFRFQMKWMLFAVVNLGFLISVWQMELSPYEYGWGVGFVKYFCLILTLSIWRFLLISNQVSKIGSLVTYFGILSSLAAFLFFDLEQGWFVWSLFCIWIFTVPTLFFLFLDLNKILIDPGILIGRLFFELVGGQTIWTIIIFMFGFFLGIF